MANNDITIRLSEEVHALMSTRIIHCLAFNCKNNLAHDAGCTSAECGLKHIYIMKNATCEQFVENTTTES
jgi:hypothetical protein